MDFKDTLNEWAQKITEKTTEVVETGKLHVANCTKNEKINELKREIGTLCFEKFRSGDEIDPEIEKLCIEIKQLKSEIAENERTILRKKEAAEGTVDMAAAGYCPFCGAKLAKDAKFCAACGKEINK